MEKLLVVCRHDGLSKNEHEDLCPPAPGALVNGMAQTGRAPLCWHYSHLGSCSQTRVMGPSSGASAALLPAVTFVPEWNFHSFFFLCFVFIFFFSSVCALSTYTDCQAFLHRSPRPKVTFWKRRRAWTRGHFSSIHQLPGCRPKIEKTLFVSLLHRRQTWSTRSRWIHHVLSILIAEVWIKSILRSVSKTIALIRN